MPTINLANVPTSGLGSPGDTKGMIAVESTEFGGKLYYCVKDYDGISRIWVSSNSTAFDSYMPFPPAPVPVISSFSTTAPGTNAITPLIQGTISNTNISNTNRRVYVSARLVTAFPGSVATVGTIVTANVIANGTTWQCKLNLFAGTWSITATSRYEAIAGGGIGVESSNSTPLTMALSPLPPAPISLPTLTTFTQTSKYPSGIRLSWTTANATSVTVNGIGKPLNGIDAQEFYASTKKPTSYNVTIVAIGPGGTTTKSVSFNVAPLK